MTNSLRLFLEVYVSLPKEVVSVFDVSKIWMNFNPNCGLPVFCQEISFQTTPLTLQNWPIELSE
jgi:hypothetical protein